MDDFDQQVAALRGKVVPKSLNRGKKKSNCTPEEWAASLDYLKEANRKYAAAHPERVKERNRRHYASDPQKGRDRAREWAESNPEKARAARQKRYYANPGKYRQASRDYAVANREKVRERMRRYNEARLKSDPNYYMAVALRVNLNRAVKGGAKKGSAVRDLGCTVAELWDHLESKFQPGMTRENHGKAWVIDHIYPLIKADLKGSRAEFLAAVNWRNLQPLTPEQNREKWDTITPEAQALFDQLCAEFREQVAA
jgi:hypothetical protein